MIVLPLNEEARSGRRTPWVTLVLVAACILSFLHHRASDAEVDARTDAALEEAWAYYLVHPYVKVDEDLAVMFGEDQVAIASQLFLDQLRASGSPGIPDFVRHHDQVDFDQKVDRVYEAMANHSFYRLGFFPDALSEPDASLLTYVLVHEDWLHLISNLALVLLAGLFIEEVWGRAIFFVFVLTGAVAGAVGYATLDPEAGEALGGASGLAAALAGAFLVRFALVPIRFQYFLIPPFGGKFTARGWVTLPIYGGAYVVADYLLTHGAPGIEPVSAEFATWAHVGGILWGMVFALGMKALRIEARFVDPQIEKKLTTRSNPSLDRALEAREAGRAEEALELLASEVVRHPDNSDAALAYWDAATAVGRPDEAASALASVLRNEVTSGQKALAIQHWRELTQRSPGFRLEAAVEVRIGKLLIDAGEHDLARFALRRVVEGSCGPVSGATAHKVARLAQDLDTDVALRAARLALASDLEPAAVAEVERLVEQLEGVRTRQAEAASESREEADGQSGPLFGRGYDFDDRDDPTKNAAAGGAGGRRSGALDLDDGGADSPDLDGDTLNAAPFELDDLTAPPGVQNFDLESAADAASPAPPAAEPTPPGVEEIDLDDGTMPPLAGATTPPLAGATTPPLAGATTPPAGGATAPPPEDGAAMPPGGTTAPVLDPALIDPRGDSFDAATLPPLDDVGDEIDLAAAPDHDIPELDRSSPDLGSSGPGLGPVMRVIEREPPDRTRRPHARTANPDGDAPDLELSRPGLGHSAGDLDLSSRDLDAGLSARGHRGLSARGHAGVSDRGHAGLSDRGHAGLSDRGHTLPGLDESLPGADLTGPGLGHGAHDLGESVPDLDLTAPPSLGIEEDEIPLADASVRTHPRVTLDDTGAPDFGNTLDMSSLGAQTLPDYDDDPPRPRPRATAPAAPPRAVDGPELEAPSPPRSLKKMEAIPLALGDEAVTLDVGERGKAQLALARIDAIAVAGVRGLRPKPVIVIDLVTNWRSGDRQPLKVVRLRSDRFDPCKLLPDEANGFAALKRWIAQLLEKTGATPLPDAASAAGSPFQMFDDLAAYEREVLRVL